MVRTECKDDARGVAQLVKRVDQLADCAIDAQQLIVQFARVRPVPMSNGVGCRKRNGEHIDSWSFAQLERVDAGECEVGGDIVHPRKFNDVVSANARVRREPMREGELLSRILDGDGVPFRVFRFCE